MTFSFLTREQLQEVITSGCLCVYNGQGIIEFDTDTDWMNLEDMTSIPFDSIDFKEFFVFDIIEENPLKNDLREVVKDFNLCLIDYPLFLKGKSSFVIMDNTNNSVLNNYAIEELFNFHFLLSVFDNLVIVRLKN